MQFWQSHWQDADDNVVLSNQALAVLVNVECTSVKVLRACTPTCHITLGMSTHCCRDVGICRFMCVFQHRAGW